MLSLIWLQLRKGVSQRKHAFVFVMVNQQTIRFHFDLQTGKIWNRQTCCVRATEVHSAAHLFHFHRSFLGSSVYKYINLAWWMSSAAIHSKMTLFWMQEDKLVWPLIHDFLWQALCMYYGQCQYSTAFTSWIFCVIEFPCTLWAHIHSQVCSLHPQKHLIHLDFLLGYMVNATNQICLIKLFQIEAC